MNASEKIEFYVGRLIRNNIELRNLGYPPNLMKSITDEYNYIMVLKDGTTFRYTLAYPVNKDWVYISGVTVPSNPVKEYEYNRGLDIRVDQISYIVDCES